MSIYVDIKKTLGSFELDVKFEAGDETVGLLGASGCGKSMTLKCIAGVAKPDEGVVIVDGVTLFDSKKRINLPPRKRRVGLLFQNGGLFPNMTVEQNVKSVLNLCKSGKAGVDERFRSISERFCIGGLENHYPAHLSGGERQRVALARIMAGNPRLIMLDEPLSALDSYLRWRLEGELLEVLEKFSGTSLYVSHGRGEVYRLCDKVCVMDNGKSDGMRTIAGLFEKPDTLAAALLSGCKNYSRADIRGDLRVYAVDWGVMLECGDTVPGDIRYIGVRAHDVGISAQPGSSNFSNSFGCTVTRVIDNVFSAIINLSPDGAPSNSDFSSIRMELPKQDALGIKRSGAIRVKIAPQDIMLLRE